MSESEPRQVDSPQPSAGPVTVEARDGAHVVRIDVSRVLGHTRSGPAWLALWVEESGELSFDANFCSPRSLEALRIEAARCERVVEVMEEGTEALHDVRGLIGGLSPSDPHFDGYLLPWDQQPSTTSEWGPEFADCIWPRLFRALVPLLDAAALRLASAAGGSTYLYDALVAHPLLTAAFERAPVLGVLAVGSAWVEPAVRAMREARPRHRLGAVADAILLHGASVPPSLKLYAFPSPTPFVQWLRRVPCNRRVLPPYLAWEEHWPDLVRAVHRACDHLDVDAFDGLETTREWYVFHAACLAGGEACRLVLTDPYAAVAVLEARYREYDRRDRAMYGTDQDWRGMVRTELERLETAIARGGVRLERCTTLGAALRAMDGFFADEERRHREALEEARRTSVPFPSALVREYTWGSSRLRWIDSTARLAELRYTPPYARVDDLEDAALDGRVQVYELERRSGSRYYRIGAAVFRSDGRLLDIRSAPIYEGEIDREELVDAMRAARVRAWAEGRG